MGVPYVIVSHPIVAEILQSSGGGLTERHKVDINCVLSIIIFLIYFLIR